MINTSTKTSNETHKRYFKVKGMTCSGCEDRIKNYIQKNSRSSRVTADYVRGLVTVEVVRGAESQPDDFIAVIEGAGYSAQEISRGQKIAGDIIPVSIAGLVILLLALAASRTGILNNIPEIRESVSYPVLFVIGLMTSVHCIGMCGGINLSQTCSAGGEDGKARVLHRGIAYNLGRLTSYTVLGGLVGGLGSVLSISFRLQGIIIIAAGFIMITMGFNMLGLFSFLKKIVPVLPSSIGDRIRRRTGTQRPYIIGLLNGFMPCGPLQSMQLYALSTGSILKGALSMFLFSAGTIPLMLIFGTVSALFSRRFQKNILRISALLIIVLGGGMISRGLNLNGINPAAPQSVGTAVSENEEKAVNAAVAEIQGDVQVVVSDVGRYAYEPIIIQAGIPVQWYLEAGAGEINGCNNAIIIPKFGIKQGLTVGRTLVEFTPEETGSIGFSCWMGMIKSRIHIVDDLSSFNAAVVDEPVENSGQQVSLVIPEFTADDIGFAEIEGELQTIDLIIREDGYFPSISVMQAGVSSKWRHLPEAVTEKNGVLIFPSYNARLDLTNEEPQTIEIIPQSDFYYYSSGGDFLGFVIVVDDLMSVSKDDILKTVTSYLR